jgi:aspartyl/asparaginyl-tRNA synthetase
VTVHGWVRTLRNDQFLAVNDGSCIDNLQVVLNRDNTPDAVLRQLSTGASVEVTGTLQASQGKGQKTEVAADRVTVMGEADAERFPIQMKRHTLEFSARKSALALPHFHVQCGVQGAPRHDFCDSPIFSRPRVLFPALAYHHRERCRRVRAKCSG